MCVAAMYWARIDKMYYANTLKDCEDIGFELAPLRDLVRSDLHARALPAERLLGAEGREVLDLWTQQPSFNRFQG
jgi:tRNA(Arg) A34 adenosine deaminase TadA